MAKNYNAGIALGGAISRFAEALGHTGETIYRVDAQRKAEDAQLEIAGRVEQFKQSLWQDPDFGTPGQNDGYMKKWQDFKKTISDEMIAKIDNPLARSEVEGFFGRSSITQEANIADIQFKRWAGATDAAAMKRISDFIDKGGIPAQVKLEYAAENLAYLKEHNLITPEAHDARLEMSSQIIIRKDLTEAAKEAYRAGGIGAAQKVIAENADTWSAGGQTFMAGEKVKEAARADLVLFDATIQAEADAAMQDSWANYVAQASGRALPNPDAPQFSLSTIQGFKTAEGFEMDSKHKEYWTNRLLSLDNGQKTGAGSLDSATANLFLGQAQKMADAIKDVKGGIRPASATIRLQNPKTGEYQTVPVTEDALRAYMRSDDFTSAMDAGGYDAWNKAGGFLQELGKPLGSWDIVLKNTVEPALKKISDPAMAAQLRGEFEAAWKAHPEWTPDQIGKYAQTDILGKAYKTQIGDILNFDPGKYDSLDTYATDAWDGRFSNAVIDGRITNPLYKATIDGNAARIQRGLEPVVGKTTIVLDDKGRTWFQGEVGKAAGLPTSREGTTLGAARSVAYTIAPLAEGSQRNAMALRDITYQNGRHVLQMNIPIGKGSEWVDVFLAPGGDRFQMSASDTSRILAARDKLKADEKAEVSRQARYSLWRSGQARLGILNPKSIEQWTQDGEK